MEKGHTAGSVFCVLRAASAAAPVLLALASAGCGVYVARARLWADTARPGTFSAQSEQWAWDGEPVTFELACDPGAADYVVFGTDGRDTVVTVPAAAGRFRWTQAFHCGPEPKRIEVYAIPFLLRGRCDWVFNRLQDRWEHYPSRTETPDVQSAPEQRMRIVCYRRTVRMAFRGRGGPPQQVRLTLLRDDGGRTEVPPRGPGPEARGFALAGPDPAGRYTVTYTPTYREVNRTGVTRVELEVRHADGSTERLTEDLDTP